MSSARRRMMMKAEGGIPAGYIQFADSAVEAICVANWSSDGIGLTYADAAAVTSIGRVFTGNTTITSFDELQYFTGLTTITASSSVNATQGAFYNCTSLFSVTLPESITSIGKAAFNKCSALESINLPNSLTALGTHAFYNCTKLALTSLNKIQSAPQYSFANTGLVSVVATDIVSTGGTGSTSSGTFSASSKLEYVEFGPNFTTLAQRTFDNCSKLATVVCRATSVPSCGANAFRNTSSSLKIYVPNGYGATYRAASGWSSYASKIYELDANGNIPS